MTNCDFLNIGFIGFGLIGGSIAKAIKAAHPEYHIIVESRSREPLIAALNDKVIDDICTCTDDNFSKSYYNYKIYVCTQTFYKTGMHNHRCWKCKRKYPQSRT